MPASGGAVRDAPLALFRGIEADVVEPDIIPGILCLTGCGLRAVAGKSCFLREAHAVLDAVLP